MEHTIDRRARRSRRLLKQGLLELMQKKRFSDISIRDITDLMDMNRGTFYLHYTDTSDLLHSLEDDMMSEAQLLIDAHIQETVEDKSIGPVLEPILDFIISERKTCEILLRNNDASGFMERLQLLMQKNGVLFVKTWAGSEDDVNAYLLSFITYGLIGLIMQWFELDMGIPKEQLIKNADMLISGAVGSTLS